MTKRSGKKKQVHWRWQCSTFLRQTVVEYAAQSILVCTWAKAFYRQQRANGSGYQAAIRALAFKWIRIIFKCWQTRTPYDEQRYLTALSQHGSPLIDTIPHDAPG